MKKLLVGLSCAAMIAFVPGAASAHPDDDCRNENACVNHCLAYHRGLDRATCLITHNILN